MAEATVLRQWTRYGLAEGVRNGLSLLFNPMQVGSVSAQLRKAAGGGFGWSPTGNAGSSVQVVDTASGGSDQVNSTQYAAGLRMLAEAPHVEAAIRFYKTYVGRATGQVVPWDKDRPVNEGVKKRIEALLNKPNELQQSYFDIGEQWIEDALVINPGVVRLELRNSREPLAMAAVDAKRFFLKKQKDDFILPVMGLFTRDDARKIEIFPPEWLMLLYDRIQTHATLPKSRVELLAQQIRAIVTADEHIANAVEEPNVDGMLNLGEDAPAKEVERVSATIRQVHRAFIVLGGSKNPNFVQFNTEKWYAMFMKFRVPIIETIATVFELPVQALGLYLDSTIQSSMRELMRSADRGPGALLMRKEEAENRQLISLFGDVAQHNCYLSYGALRNEDRGALAASAAQTLAGQPWQTIDEIRAMAGLEPTGSEIGKQIMFNDGTMSLVTLETVALRDQMYRERMAKGQLPNNGAGAGSSPASDDEPSGGKPAGDSLAGEDGDKSEEE